MNHWMAVHTFVDVNVKLRYHIYMSEIKKLKTKGGKSFTQSVWAKESTAEFFFSNRLTDSGVNIFKQLEIWCLN